MNDLMKGLEGLEGEVETEENTVIEGDEDAIKDAVLEVVEDETEVVEMEGEVEEMEDANDDFEESYEHLTNLQDAIDQYGLCKPMAAVMGKNYHSLAAAGIVPSFESLDDLPVKGAVSMEASKTIGSRLKAAWEAVKRFLANLWAKLKEMFSRFVALFQKYDTILKGLQAKLKDAKFDDKKLKAKEITIIGMQSMDEISKATAELLNVVKTKGITSDITAYLNEAISLMNSGVTKDKVEAKIKDIEKKYETFCNTIPAGMKKFGGIEVKKSGEVTTITSTTPAAMKQVKKQKIEKAGWKDIATFNKKINEAITLAAGNKELQKDSSDLDKAFSVMDKAISALITAGDKKDEKHQANIAIYEKSLKVGKSILMGKKAIISRAVSNSNFIIKQTIIASRAALSCLE